MSSVFNPETYLELVQRAHSECAVQGDPPQGIANAVGVNKRLFIWVNESWRILQGLREDWHFMWRAFSFATVAGQITYTPTQAGISEGVVSSWRKDRMCRYQTASGRAGEIRMTYFPYDEFQDSHNIGTLRTAQRNPQVWTQDPSMNLMIECPLTGYTVTGEAYVGVTGMDEDTDIPTGLDVEDRMWLVARAMEFYANDENAPEVLATAQREQKRILSRLELRRLQRLTT